MATTLEEIASFLDQSPFLYDVRSEYNDIITFYKTSNYIDRGGDYILPIVLLVEEEGRFLKIFAPNCYSYKGTVYVKEFFQALLMISFHTKMLQFECDQEAEMIFAMVEFPLEDARLTQKQLFRAIDSLAVLIDRFDPAVRLVLETGEIHLGEESVFQDSFLQLLNEDPQEEDSEQESDEWI